MALNKSNKSTPSSRSGYFTELTASGGKQSSFLLPVRIKVSPNSKGGPMSEGKKNPSKFLQPVLLKDLFPSAQKDKNNSTVTSASTVKKRARSQRVTQPYLNTQSCYKPKREEGESSFLSRKSFGGSKVRRQLYQTLDSPQKSAAGNKENKISKPKKKATQESDEQVSSIEQNKIRKSLLLPPNSIKNTFLKKTDSNFKVPTKQAVKSSSTTISNKNIGKSKQNAANKRKTTVVTRQKDGTSMELDSSSRSCSSDQDEKQSFHSMRDNFTMTSPTSDRGVSNTLCSNQLERPSVIMGPSKIIDQIEPPYREMQRLCINSQCCCPGEMAKQSFQNGEFNFFQNTNSNNLQQFKSFLEQSIRACEEQASTLKQVLNFVTKLSNNSEATNSEITEETANPGNESILNNQNDSDATDIVDKSLETKSLDTVTEVDDKTVQKEVEDELPIPLRILITEADNQDSKEVSLNALNEMARLSTIGEVSCEGDEYNKTVDSENKENMSGSFTQLPTLQTPKNQRRKSQIPESCENRRRSLRLAAKRLSESLDSDKQDSFTMLENELNVEHRAALPSKSLPASPMKPPMTPGTVRQWDKKVERPLREYMALKMNGTFLVTPDVKRFQSCLEPTDTPHSRKSLSRKIFMELCDLYAESPEPK